MMSQCSCNLPVEEDEICTDARRPSNKVASRIVTTDPYFGETSGGLIGHVDSIDAPRGGSGFLDQRFGCDR